MRRMLIAITLLVAACAPMTGVGGAADPAALDGTSWVLSVISGRAAVAGSNVTLSFETGGASGSTGCNQYRATYVTSRSTLTFGNALMTKRACVENERNAQESAYVGALSRVASFSATEERLTLKDAAAATVVELTRQR